MSHPSQLTPPPLRAYPFISMVFSYATEHNYLPAHSSACSFMVFTDREFHSTKFFSKPLIQPAQSAPLTAMTDETFSKVARVIGLKISDVPVSTRAELLEAAKRLIEHIAKYDDEPVSKFSADQLHAYMLYMRSDSLCVHWGQLAELYNESTDDQQQAISDLFEHVFNRPLERLMEVPAPLMTLPPKVQPVLQTRKVRGDTLCFCEQKQSWLRDDVMAAQFRIRGYRAEGDEVSYLIATGSTLQEAFGLAIAFTQGISESESIRILKIDYDTQPVATAQIRSAPNRDPKSFKIGLPARLQWNTDTFGNPRFRKDQLIKLILKTEQSMGVQWCKVLQLEDDLGL